MSIFSDQKLAFKHTAVSLRLVITTAREALKRDASLDTLNLSARSFVIPHADLPKTLIAL